ncbi:MAG: hypothetical protein ACFFB3_05960 [Candidatus Hodarchaeota archaeon]
MTLLEDLRRSELSYWCIRVRLRFSPCLGKYVVMNDGNIVVVSDTKDEALGLYETESGSENPAICVQVGSEKEFLRLY